MAYGFAYSREGQKAGLREKAGHLRKWPERNWIGKFGKRIRIKIDHQKIDQDLSWFPLTIFLKPGNGDTEKIFEELKEKKYKIALTTEDLRTQLYIEIEKWDYKRKEAVLHASREGITISSSKDTIFYLLYDKNADDNLDYVGDNAQRYEVWDNNFVAVYHLSQKPTGASEEYKNSKQDRYHGSRLPDPDEGPSREFGKVGYSQKFIRANYQGIVLAEAINFDNENEQTLEGLVKPVSDNNMTIIDYVDAATYPYAQYLFYRSTTDGLRYDVRYDNNYNESVYGGEVKVGEWNYCVATKASDGVMKVYINANEVGSANNTPGFNTPDPAFRTGIGARRDKNNDPHYGYNYFDGFIDEVRVSKVARSLAWIKATYYSLFDQLISYGREEVPS